MPKACVIALAAMVCVAAPPPASAAPDTAAAVRASVPLPGGTAALSDALGIPRAFDRAFILLDAIHLLHENPPGESPETDLKRRQLASYLKTLRETKRSSQPADETIPLPLTPAIWSDVVLDRRVRDTEIAFAILEDRQASLLYYGLFALDDDTLRFLAGDRKTLALIFKQHAGVFAVTTSRGGVELRARSELEGRIAADSMDRATVTPPDSLTPPARVGAAIVEPGAYRLKYAAIDGTGRRGTVDLRFDARLTPAGPLTLSDLVLGRAENGAFRPAMTPLETSSTVTGYLEIYAPAQDAPEDVTVQLSVVDRPALARVLVEHRARLASQHVPDDLDPPLPQVVERLAEHRALIEPDRLHVLRARAADDARDAAPEDGAEAHGAGRAGGHQLVLREARLRERVASHRPLGEHDGDDLGVEDRVGAVLDEVDASRDERAVLHLEDRGAKGSARATLDVLARQIDGEPHALVGVGKRRHARDLRGQPVGYGD